jgi:cytochrome-b5 reductase
MSLKFIDAEGKPVMRSYTPVSSDDDLGYFDLLVKLYPAGKMSQHLLKLQVGDTIAARGPSGSLEYKGAGNFEIKRTGGRVQEVNIKNVGMLAGGSGQCASRTRTIHYVNAIMFGSFELLHSLFPSGITPMLQILRDVQKHSATDFTRLALIFANQTEQDILLRTELEELREARSLTSVAYTLDKPAEEWKGEKGFVSTEMIKKYLPPPSPSTLVLICGPPPMVVNMEKNLQALGYTEDMYFKY